MSSGGGSSSDGGGGGGASQRGTIDRTAPTGISGPAGGASAGGNYGGDSSGGYSDSERGQQQASNQGPAGGASAGGDYGGNINPSQTYAGRTVQEQRDYQADPEGYIEKQNQVEQDLTFKEHWDNAPKAIRWSPTLRFLYSSGKNLGEWAKNKGWNYNSNTGNFTDNSGGNVGERDLMNAAAPEAPGLVSGQSNTQTTTGYSASQWYANLGNTNTTGSNPFSFSTAFADAKAKQQTILGNPSAIKQLAVNESPFYGFLKENSLDKGIL